MQLLFKAILPLFIALSYTVIPIFAQDAEDGVVSPEVLRDAALEDFKDFKEGMCEVSGSFFKDHPEYMDLKQADIFAAGAEFDITSTVMRLIPQDQNCSKEIEFDKDSCMACRSDRASITKPMMVATKPLKTTAAPRTQLLICPNGPGTCPPWSLNFPLEQGYSLVCIFNEPGNGPPRRPISEPLAKSAVFATGVKVKVPCERLKKTRVPPSRRPW